MADVLLLTVPAAGAFVVCDGLSAHWGKTGSKASFVAFCILSPMDPSATRVLT